MPNIIRTGGGGGEVKEMFDFPLSIQTAVPTPVNSDHIHIISDAKLPLIIDEAIRAGSDDAYFAIVDSTDNNSITEQSPKALTDGSYVAVTNKHIARDTAPWHVSNAVTVGKKKGISLTADNYAKWPRIYSRKSGVIDMEDAKRWDGSAWQWLSQKGKYLAMGRGSYSAGISSSILYNRSSSSLTLHSDLPSFPSAAVLSTKWSKDGSCVFYGLDRAPFLVGYKRDGDSFSQLSIAVHTNAVVQDIDISPDGMYMAVCHGIGTAAALDIYKKSTGDWTFLTELMGYTGSTLYIYGCSWSPDGNYLAFCGSNILQDTLIGRYKRVGDTFTRLGNPDALPAGTALKIKYSPDGNYIAVRLSQSPFISCYHVVSDTQWKIIAAPTSLPLGVPNTGSHDIVFAPSSGYLFVASSNSIYAYTYSENGLVFKGTISTGLSGSITALAISTDGTKMACTGASSPYFKWFEVSGMQITALTSPGILPSLYSLEIDFLG